MPARSTNSPNCKITKLRNPPIPLVIRSPRFFMTFRAMTGHRSLLALLARATALGSLPPSLIFSGPDGIGKRMAAVALAQALNCERPIPWPEDSGVSGCGECAACRRIVRGVHADVLFIEPADTGSIGIDQVREAIDRAAYRPFEGRKRVVIVDEADTLVQAAQNALLKTLEEPPAASVFVLVTARPDLLLPTVRSRCQQLRFGPLAPADVADVLMREHGMASEEARAAAAASDGSIGRAIDGGADEIVASREAAARLLQTAAASADPRRRLDGAKMLAGGASDRGDLARRLRAVSSLLRDLAVLLSRADDSALANADLKPQLQSLLRSFDDDRALRAFSAVDTALSALDRNASPKIVADWVALQI
ncbi:MAG: DNA polymerase III subunit delta' [Acidobacteria bacterium]|nr:MAG: DNA polymerase III subunit delta' [Acidobacteriota bacterium]